MCVCVFVGLFCIRYPEMMLQTEMRELITEWLTKDCASTKKIEVRMETGTMCNIMVH